MTPYSSCDLQKRSQAEVRGYCLLRLLAFQVCISFTASLSGRRSCRRLKRFPAACVSSYSNNLFATEMPDGVSLKIQRQLYGRVARRANERVSDGLCLKHSLETGFFSNALQRRSDKDLAPPPPPRYSRTCWIGGALRSFDKNLLRQSHKNGLQ